MGPQERTPIQRRAVETHTGLLEGAALVFSQKTYAGTRLKDIAAASGSSEGALYFHFGSKRNIAEAVLTTQQERMTEVLTQILAQPVSAREKMLDTIEGLAQLIASDLVVQGGIKLSSQPIPDLESTSRDPYFAWITIARELIEEGIRDGSIRADLDADSGAEFINAVFVGGQVLSEMEDGWASFPARARRFRATLTRFLGDGSS